MRFPFSLSWRLGWYLLRKRFSGQKRFALVLMLEPLHTCNLHCEGCGRIREYGGRLEDRLSVAECVAAADECAAPIVSLCGGEPLLYPELSELLKRLIAMGKHIYLCTNGTLLADRLSQLPRNRRIMLNIHLDGMEATHDALVGRSGAFGLALEGIRQAKHAGWFVYTNTTVYRHTDMSEIIVLFTFLTQLGVDGMMLSPAYGYEAVQTSAPERASAIFLTRQEIQQKFRTAWPMLRRFRVVASPIYLEFLCGRRQLGCAAWANPTFNRAGWRSPCYLRADRHYPTYQQLLEQTDWDSVGPGRDPRCQHCMVHCGFEPAAVLGRKGVRDWLRMAWWQLG
ncbi:MAG: adenosyl-hopene transferase HpnH [Thermoguttaceae bacterium]|nr:adenosyl-hopene transferase HpnH [Thermoguttaceae bacterium]MDW8037626.1 adenosyl-hopene transferase HpnH [Thermoguttaceae bacterium]